MKKHVLMVLALLLVVSSVSAIETPRGIDGHVYGLDGVTPVPSQVTLEIENLDTNEVVQTNIGRGGLGRYSVALGWPKGTNVQVRASNPAHSASRDLVLSGIAHDVDLYLNMSLPPTPPEFTSVPGTFAREGREYSYQATVFDWNNDIIVYSFSSAPAGMTVDDGLVTWIPEQGGVASVVLTANDGTFSVNQSFSISVENVNEPPVFENITLRVHSRKFRHQLVASDPDFDKLNFSVVQGAPGLTVSSSGLLEYRHRGNSRRVEAIVSVSDGFENATATVTLLIVSRPGGGGGGGGGGGFPPPSVDLPKPIKKLVQKLLSAPEGVRPLQKLTYAYFRIPEGSDDHDFTISKSWLSKYNIKPEDVKVFSYAGSWKEQRGKTELFDSGLRISTSVSGGTLYAIAADQLPAELPLEQLIIVEPTNVVGFVVNSGGEPINNIAVIIRDESGDEVLIESGTGPAKHVFQFVLEDVRGKTFTVKSADPRYKGETTFVAGSLNEIELVLQPTGLLSITGLFVGGFTENVDTIGLVGLLLIVCVGAAVFLRKRVGSIDE